MQVSLNRGHAVKRLAQPDQPFIGVNMDPENVREFVQAQGLQPRDLHRTVSFEAGSGRIIVSCGDYRHRFDLRNRRPAGTIRSATTSTY
jgi:hypothetical protein